MNKDMYTEISELTVPERRYVVSDISLALELIKMGVRVAARLGKNDDSIVYVMYARGDEQDE